MLKLNHWKLKLPSVWDPRSQGLPNQGRKMTDLSWKTFVTTVTPNPAPTISTDTYQHLNDEALVSAHGPPDPFKADAVHDTE